MEHEGEPHAQVGGDARRHGQHHGVGRGPRGRWTGVPVLRRASGGVQAFERGRAHDAQAVVVVPAVRDHLGGLTSGEAQGRSGAIRSSISPPAAVLGRPPAATMTTSSTPSGGRRRGSRRAHPAFGPAGGVGRRAVPRAGPLGVWPCRNAWIRSTSSSTGVTNRWWPAAVPLPGVEPVTSARTAVCRLQLGERPTQPDHAAPCGPAPCPRPALSRSRRRPPTRSWRQESADPIRPGLRS
jgi:hypothetical protein